ncbi:lipase family protein [Nocardia huaxiensis]|uniref:lipase family protein n=1 Tax=Nocardia huaxiensis TaxID=2755382 RepID=UPI001E5ECC59|nr:lipase family protein [Nocardia huaxiensis]UFS99066.1 lipase family protein [Nocardia huaxiensis]
MTVGDAFEIVSPRADFGSPGRPLLPDEDPFYQTATDLTGVAPGTVLRTRRVRTALFGRIPQKVRAWQLLYRSSDRHGAPEAAVTTVLLPWGADPAQSRPLVSFQCAIDAVAPKCFPSYALQHRARALGSIPQLELPLIAAALERGWAVSVPDHEGLGGHFGAAREPGFRALDGIRAALSFSPLGLDSSTRIGLWGYSGGGLATAWAAEEAADYAPELNIVGAVAGSPVGDPAMAFVRLNGSPFAGFAMVFTAGLRRAYPGVEKVLRTKVSADYLALLARAEHTATLPLLARFAGRNAQRHITGGVGALLTHPDMRAVLDEIRPGAKAPAMPMFVLQGVNDEVIAVADVDAHVQRYRDRDVHIRYVRDRLSAHLPLQFIGVPAMVDWLDDRFAVRPLGAAGVETVWSVALSGKALSEYRAFAALFAKMVSGRPIRARSAPR